MTSQSGQEKPARLCLRCCGIGTHSLTCPLLRLAPGYRVLADPDYEAGPETSHDARDTASAWVAVTAIPSLPAWPRRAPPDGGRVRP
jgi:hypothetical protein